MALIRELYTDVILCPGHTTVIAVGLTTDFNTVIDVRKQRLPPIHECKILLRNPTDEPGNSPGVASASSTV
jgi:hypothetical protein